MSLPLFICVLRELILRIVISLWLAPGRRNCPDSFPELIRLNPCGIGCRIMEFRQT